MIKGPHINLAHLVAIPPYAIVTIVHENDPSASAIPGNLTLALELHVQPFAAAHVRLPDVIVASLAPAEAEYLLLQGESGEGATVRIELSPHPYRNCLALVAALHFITGIILEFKVGNVVDSLSVTKAQSSQK